MSDYFGASWVGVMLAEYLGMHESDPKLNAKLVPHWAKVGLKGYKSLVGNARAWCSLLVDFLFVSVGLKGTGSAGAYSWSKWGIACPYWFGAVLPIKHVSGGRHVCFFLYWIDESKGLCATLDGNRSNRFALNVTTLSKGHDQLVGGPRWPAKYAAGKLVSMAEVIKAYPRLTAGGISGGGSTR